MTDIDQTDDLENGAIATPANSFRGGKVYNLAKKLFVLPMVLLLACSDDNSASATADPQTPTSSESTGISSSSENPGQTIESSDEFMIVPETPPDSVREEIEAAMRVEWLNNQISHLNNANECSSIEGVTEEEISYCKTRFCNLYPEIWQGCEE
ncbi:MAG: hypothetical protein IKB43_03795 [Fibrobacter sp.]|nr:hypothetical protein [Fibrobacter sp.]